MNRFVCRIAAILGLVLFQAASGAVGSERSPELALFQPSLSLTPGQAGSMRLADLEAGGYYGILVFVPEIRNLGPSERIDLTVDDSSGEVVRKALHAGDPDLYLTLKPRKSGHGSITALWISDQQSAMTLSIQVTPMKVGNGAKAIVAAQPNGDWRNAQPMELGRTVFGSNDERSYIPALDSASNQLKEMFSGAQWFTFTWAGPNPILVHFDVTILDRDIPVDVTLFAVDAGGGDAGLVPYEEGKERFVPEKSTAFHGLYKFIARVVRPGTYYVRIMGNHPAFELRTKLYPIPPYDDPRQAVRTGMDYLVKKGDSWHANTPRRGGVILRTSNPLQETSLCIACHPTHFTTRGELVAIENGYPLLERYSMQFLTDRLYNNPRPIYGKPEAAWVRMISAPGNVMSRLAYMLFTFEKTVSHEERPGLLQDIGNYLEMYWKNLEGIYAESNGNAPKVSGFEIALHNGLLFQELYRRTGQEKYRELREKMERIALEGEPKDHIDLCWNAIALATFDKTKHAAELKGITEEIFSRQKEDGTWSMPYGKVVYEHNYRQGKDITSPAPLDEKGEARASEFQTYHCVYALAKAGVTMNDPRLAKAVRWCLSRQQPSGGWQGNKDYKNFDTPFRDTQYAIMALSELFKGPGNEGRGGTGWMAGFDAAPKWFDLADTAAALEALDQYWEDPGPETRSLMLRALDSPQPLVRQAAAAALGRIADAEAIPKLAVRLGDPSKLVQRASAWALRQIASRRGVGYESIQTALASGDDRTRWGAARVFNQHFRYLSDQWQLAGLLLNQMKDDPAAAVRMEAAQAMWRWWYWTKSDDRKGEIEDRFILCMNQPEHPWVRRNLVEGFHNLIDDNVGYFYNSWTRQISSDDDRQVVIDGQHATVKRQAEKLARVLAEGSDLQKEGVLRGFYSFHLRESGGDEKLVADVADPPYASGDWLMGYRNYVAFDPLKDGTGVMARIGNDHDFPTFYEDSAPLIASGLLAALRNASPEMTVAALKAFKHTDGVDCGEPLSNRLIELALDAPSESGDQLRVLVQEILPERIEVTAEVARNLGVLVEKGSGGTLKIAEAILTAKRNAKLAGDDHVASALKSRILSSDLDSPDLPTLEDMLVQAPRLQADREIVDKSFTILLDGPPAARRSAVRSMITGRRFLLVNRTRDRFQAELNVASPEMMLDTLGVLQKIDFAKLENENSLSLGLGAVTTAFGRPEPAVRKEAIDAVRTMVAIQQNPSVLAWLKTLAADADQAVAQSAQALLDSIKLRGEKASQQDVSRLLDYDYFARHVDPIFQAKGKDSEACADCHMNHTILKLNPETLDQKLTAAQLRENYLSALKVVDLNNPEESLLLIKPRMPFDGIEVPGNYRKTHGGNLRWMEDRETDAYKTVLKWIQGAKAEVTVGQAP